MKIKVLFYSPQYITSHSALFIDITSIYSEMNNNTDNKKLIINKNNSN